MRDRRLAVRYAKALLSVLSDPAEAEATDGFLTSVSSAIEQSAELRTILLDPAVPRDQRRQALRALAEAKNMPRAVGNF